MTKRVCSVDGCSRPHAARGYCSLHYKRWWYYGEPLAGQQQPSPPRPRRSHRCTVDGCGRPHESRGYCGPHYLKWRKYGDPLAEHRPVRRACSVDGCVRPHLGQGYCKVHWELNREGPRCAVDDCPRPSVAKGWCRLHYDRWRRHGDPLVRLPRGQRAGRAPGVETP